MNLHEVMAADLDDVFFNMDEFACVHEIEGKKIACIVDESDGMASTGAADGFRNVAGIGILAGERIVLCKAADLIPQPRPGQKIMMDGKYWLVGDDLSETEGLLRLPLARAY